MMRQLKKGGTAISALAVVLALFAQGAWASPGPGSNDFENVGDYGTDDEGNPLDRNDAELEEGTEVGLTAEQLKGILPWALDSKLALEEILGKTKRLQGVRGRDQLVREMQAVVHESAPSEAELLMRFALNRGMKVLGTLEEKQTGSVGAVPVEIDWIARTARASVQLAAGDMERMKEGVVNPPPIPYAAFGWQYATLLSAYLDTVQGAVAQYEIYKLTYGYLQRDLFRDVGRHGYAPIIGRLDRMRRLLPKSTPNDRACVRWSREMKRELREALADLKKMIPGNSDLRAFP